LGWEPGVIEFSRCHILGIEYTYDCYTIIVDMCLLVKFVLEFCVFYLGHDTARMQTYRVSIRLFFEASSKGGVGILVRLTLGLLETTVSVSNEAAE
jgi:hypothetical protein